LRWQSTDNCGEKYGSELFMNFVRYRKGALTGMAKHNKTDRRSQRTRQLLRNALVDLMMEMPFQAISIQDILDRANVGRTTFYEHFMDKDDLLMSNFERMLTTLDFNMLEDQPDSGENKLRLLPSLGLLRHIKDQQRLLKAIVFGQSYDLISKHLQSRVSDLVERKLAGLASNGKPPQVPLPVLANFVAGSFLMLLKWWFDGNPISPNSNLQQYSAEAVNAMFEQMTYPGVYAALGISE
jgi:AcrR family transcriptional regulator